MSSRASRSRQMNVRNWICVPVVEPNGVGALQPGHASHQVWLRRFKRDMIMIGHQATSMHLPAGLLAGFSQGFNEVLPVNVVQEYLLAAVASADNVTHGPGVLNAQFARHGPVIPASRSCATKKQTKL